MWIELYHLGEGLPQTIDVAKFTFEIRAASDPDEPEYYREIAKDVSVNVRTGKIIGGHIKIRDLADIPWVVHAYSDDFKYHGRQHAMASFYPYHKIYE